MQINDKFAKLSNSLYVAERTARQEVATRSQIQKNVTQREKAKREDMLRKLAEDARSNRGPAGVTRDAYVPFLLSCYLSRLPSPLDFSQYSNGLICGVYVVCCAVFVNLMSSVLYLYVLLCVILCL